MKIDTASGKTTVDFEVDGQCIPLNQTVTPLVMAAGTPKVVSTRLRCVVEGYSFLRQIWKPVHNCRTNTRFTCTTAKVKVKTYVRFITNDAAF